MECLGDENMLYLFGDSETYTGTQRMVPFPQPWERILESVNECLLLAPDGQGLTQPELHCLEKMMASGW